MGTSQGTTKGTTPTKIAILTIEMNHGEDLQVPTEMVIKPLTQIPTQIDILIGDRIFNTELNFVLFKQKIFYFLILTED